jgi:hypothetical protein
VGSQVQAGGEDDVSLDELDAVVELGLQLLVPDRVGRRAQLPEQLLQPAPGGVPTPLFRDKNTHHTGKSQSTRPHAVWKRPLTGASRG